MPSLVKPVSRKVARRRPVERSDRPLVVLAERDAGAAIVATCGGAIARRPFLRGEIGDCGRDAVVRELGDDRAVPTGPAVASRQARSFASLPELTSMTVSRP